MARRRSVEIACAPYDPMASVRDPVAPERHLQSQSLPNLPPPMNAVAAGENPNGFTAQTPNGTSHAGGNGTNQRGWFWVRRADGERWNGPVNWAKNGGDRSGE